MNTGIKLSHPVKVPLGKYTSIHAHIGIPVEVVDWKISKNKCYQVKLTLWVSGFKLIYEGPLRISLMDIDWDQVEKHLR